VVTEKTEFLDICGLEYKRIRGKIMPSVIKRGNGYRIFVSLRSDESGKAVRKTTTFHPPLGVSEKKARFLAESYAYQLEGQLKCFSELDDSCRFQVLCDWYFEIIAPNRVKERTLMNNRDLLTNYVLPKLGNARLRDITPIIIDRLLHELLRHGKLRTKEP